MTVQEELLRALRKAVDFEKRFGHREDVPAVHENWQVVVSLIEELCRCQKQKRALSEIKLPSTKTRQG